MDCAVVYVYLLAHAPLSFTVAFSLIVCGIVFVWNNYNQVRMDILHTPMLTHHQHTYSCLIMLYVCPVMVISGLTTVG